MLYYSLLNEMFEHLLLNNMYCYHYYNVQAKLILPVEQTIPRSTYIHPPAVNAAKGAF